METTAHQAKAQGKNMPVSWKDCTEIGRFLKGDSVEKAKRKLSKVIEKDLPVPYTKFDSDAGHRSGQGDSGGFPVKAAENVLEVLEGAESNAEHEGLNPSNLYLEDFITNQGREFRTPGRHQGTNKRAHVEIVVGEK